VFLGQFPEAGDGILTTLPLRSHLHGGSSPQKHGDKRFKRRELKRKSATSCSDKFFFSLGAIYEKNNHGSLRYRAGSFQAKQTLAYRNSRVLKN
jgi:hypothetical protein